MNQGEVPSPILFSLIQYFLALALRRKRNIEIVIYDACNQRSTTADMQKFLSSCPLSPLPDLPMGCLNQAERDDDLWESFEILDFASFDFFPNTPYTACLLAIVPRLSDCQIHRKSHHFLFQSLSLN
jgi:hypothetical protein